METVIIHLLLLVFSLYLQCSYAIFLNTCITFYNFHKLLIQKTANNIKYKKCFQQLILNIRKVSNYNKLGHGQIDLFNQDLYLKCSNSLIMP